MVHVNFIVKLSKLECRNVLHKVPVPTVQRLTIGSKGHNPVCDSIAVKKKNQINVKHCLTTV